MAFVQIIEFTTDDYDALLAVDEEWRRATEGKRTLRREIVARDRNQPNRYLTLAFFDSYESAMENSNLPETSASAEKFQALTDGLAFQDLDIIRDID